MATEQTVTATIKEEYARDGSLESTEATVAKTTTGADDDTIDLPSDPITVMLAALLLIAVLAVAYFAAPIVLPIVLVEQHLEPDEVFRLFRAADACHVNSVDDGMNLQRRR